MAQQTLNTPRETTHQRIADALEDIVDKIVDTSSASNIDYDNTQSGLDADKVQGAVDELASEKVDKVQGKGLSTNDYTDTEKQKLAGIEAGANKTVVDSAINDRSTNPLQNRVITAALDEKTDVSNFNALTQEIELFNTYDLTNDVEISVFANDTYKRDKYDRVYETHIPNLDGEYSVSLGDKTFTETCTFTIANQGTSITETFHTNRKYILGAKLLKAENDEVGDAHVIADVVTLLISKDAPYTTTFDPYLEHPPATGVLTLKVSVKPDEKYVNKENTGGPAEYAYWGSYNGSDLLINNPILTYSETTFGQPKVSGNPITIGASESNLVECVAEVEPIQEGSGDPSPDNIRPIIGQTEVVIDDVGKNLWDEGLLEIGGISGDSHNKDNSTTWVRGTKAIFLSSGTYNLSSLNFIGRISNVYEWSAEVIRGDNFVRKIIEHVLPCSFTLAESAYISFEISVGRTVTLDDLTNSNVQLELGSTATAYEPYAAKTYTIQLGDTIYGGELDVVTGRLTVTHGEVDLGDLSWIYHNESGNFYVDNAVGDRKAKNNAICSCYEKNSNVYSVAELTSNGKFAFQENLLGRIIIRDTRYTNATAFKTAVTGQTLVYELATPYTIQLTPEQIRLLKGTNNISCNTGDLNIKYYPDNVLGQLKGDIESEYDARLERLEQYTDVFGFIEDMDVLSPTERIKYIGKNENYEPLTVDLNTGSYTLGDWGNFPFLVDNKPYMVKPDGTPDYQLNEYDYTKKLDGTDSDVANEDYDGGAFSWGRKIYKKQWMVGNKRHVLFSFDKKDGFHADGFINKDGKELDGRWIPMFYGTVVNGKAKSIATGNCITGGNLTTDAQHNAIVAFDSDANFFGGAFVETLIDLLMMFAKNSDLQAAYGYGNSSGYVDDSSKNYGMLNNAVVGGGQFYGRSDGKTLNKALHSIVLATYNTYMRDPYEVIKNGEVVVSEDYTYDPTGATYTDTGITVPNQSASAWRYPKKYIAVPRYGSIPDISVGGASTSLGRSDGTYTLANQSGAVLVCLRFGRCISGAAAGLSCRDWDGTASDAGWDFGFALLLDGSAVV